MRQLSYCMAVFLGALAAGLSVTYLMSDAGGTRSEVPVEVEWRQAMQEELEQALGGERVVETLHNPEHVEAVLLTTPDDPQSTRPHEYLLAGEPVAVDSGVAATISSFLLDARLQTVWPKGLKKGCIPIYGLRLSYLARSDRVDLYVCFQCDDLVVYLNEERVPYGWVAFDIEELLDDALAIFPGNAELVELEKQRREAIHGSVQHGGAVIDRLPKSE